MKHAVLINLFLAGSALAMPAANPDKELGSTPQTNQTSGGACSLFSQESLDIQKKCHEQLFNDKGIQDIDQAGKNAICVAFAREAIKCRDDDGCLDNLGLAGDRCLKSIQESDEQSAGKVADVFLDCFRKRTSGDRPGNSADPGRPALDEAFKLYNSCKGAPKNGCAAELQKSANHYMDVQNNAQDAVCRGHVRESAQECMHFLENKTKIDESTQTAFRDCVNNRYDTSMRDAKCSAENKTDN